MIDVLNLVNVRFEPWPEETLEVIAKKCLEDIPGLNDKLQGNYLGFLKSVHNSMRSCDRYSQLF